MLEAFETSGNLDYFCFVFLTQGFKIKNEASCHPETLSLCRYPLCSASAASIHYTSVSNNAEGDITLCIQVTCNQ